MNPKILSLEEIEKWQDIAERYKYYELFDHINEDGLKALLATARAYHELKNEPATRHSTTMQNIGMLRQWLNEERVDKKKMVSNKDICRWLDIPLPEGYQTDEEVISEAMRKLQTSDVEIDRDKLEARLEEERPRTIQDYLREQEERTTRELLKREEESWFGKSEDKPHPATLKAVEKMLKSRPCCCCSARPPKITNKDFTVSDAIDSYAG